MSLIGGTVDKGVDKKILKCYHFDSSKKIWEVSLMPNILVRDLDGDIVNRLKAIAKRHGRSLQGEVKVILYEATALSMKEAKAISERWRKHFSGRPMSDSAESIREDRNR